MLSREMIGYLLENRLPELIAVSYLHCLIIVHVTVRTRNRLGLHACQEQLVHLIHKFAYKDYGS